MISPNTPDLSYRRLARKGRHMQAEPGRRVRRIAILSDAASQQFVPVLCALFAENDVNAEFYEGGFDAMEIETFNSASGLYQFKPDIILLAFCAQALRARYFHDPQGDFAARTLDRIEQIWSRISTHTTAQILQYNFVIPYERIFGNFDVQVPGSLYASTARLNAGLVEAAGKNHNVTILDVDAISSQSGRANWFDDRLWNMTKAFCQLDLLPLVCQSVVEVVLSLMGRVLKCMVLDLDNTLWGGVVGDLGHLGVDIGAHGDGEAFFHFQSYLLALKRRGIILAVCSKNELENALRPFTDNPDMVLKRDDIAVFVANWDNKADNIRTIRERLNIGLDSMIFIDDNPFERNLVRQLAPEVVVPEMPEDPADYVRYLSGLNLFEATSFSAEDARRADQYKEEADRLELRAAVTDIGEYLRSLEMKIRVTRFDSENIPRISQLTQRSNQFNLTTQRLNEAECRQIMEDTKQLPIYASLSDRFGDHGLIAVITLKLEPDTLDITNWLMSCRVLARGVEEYLMAHVVEIAQTHGLSRIVAEYIPSPKNGMVKDFYGRFGFEQLSNDNGHTCWNLNPSFFQPTTTYMTRI